MVDETIGVLIGRFQLGPHESHKDIIKQAASKVDRLIILIGSANQRISPKNPFSAAARADMVIRTCWEMEVFNATAEPLNDYPYNDGIWAQGVRETVIQRASGARAITLYGHHKDETSFYLDMFPEWGSVELQSKDSNLSSTHLRKEWFDSKQVMTDVLKKQIPFAVQRELRDHIFDADLQSEYDYYIAEKERFIKGWTEVKPNGIVVIHKPFPYPETLNFCCGDVVLECAGHIALGKRKNAPGRNCWAIFGGFKNNNETYLECALRELGEEANIKVSNRVLRKSIKATHMFDKPSRSQGIARNSLAVHIKIDANPDGTLPSLKGMDDIGEVQWFPIHEVLNELVLFDDHKDIISHFTGMYQRFAHLS